MNRRGRRCAVPATALLLLALAACTGTADDQHPAPAPLTGAQAESLALTRFTNYRAGSAHATAAIPVTGRHLILDARLDWRAHTGYGLLRDATAGATQHWQHLLRWTPTSVSVHYNWRGAVPVRPPGTGWAQRDLQPSTSTVDTALVLLLELASDRPDNAQLLVRSGARRLGTTTLDGRTVTEFSGPSSRGPAGPAAGAGEAGSEAKEGAGAGRTRYWIDAGDVLRRFAALLPATSAWMTVDLAPVEPRS